MSDRTRSRMTAIAVVMMGAVACGGGGEEPMPAEDPMEDALAPVEDRSSMIPSVGFVSPTDGANVSSPVSMEFIVSNYNVSPVPQEVETPRQGMGHHHVGIDTECLPVGEVVPQGGPPPTQSKNPPSAMCWSMLTTCGSLRSVPSASTSRENMSTVTPFSSAQSSTHFCKS